MKNLQLILLSALILFSTTLLTGQEGWHIGKWKVQKIDFSLGYETDYVNNMDYNFFLGHMEASQQAELANLNFQDSDFVSGICENPSINLGLTLQHPALKSLEWRNSFSYKPNRRDGVYYYNSSDYAGEFVSINGTHAEFALESAAIFRLPVFSFFNLYGGVGTNLGITDNNRTCVRTSFDISGDNVSFRADAPDGADFNGYSDCFHTGSQINQRVFLQVGTGFVMFKRVEFGIDMKYGVGYRADLGQSVDGTQLVSTNLNLRYHL